MSERLLGALRTMAVGALAGALAGALVGGLGGRLVMRVSGHLTHTDVTLRTANGNQLGEITLAGTIALVIFAGIAPGMMAGVLYAVLRPSLAWAGRLRGLVLGAGLLAIAGPLAIEPFNVDFDRFGMVWLNVLMFAALFVLMGLALAPLYELVERSSRGASSMGEVQVLALVVWVSVPAGVLMVVLLAAVSVTNLATLVRVGAISDADLATVMLGAAMLAAIALALARELRPRLVGPVAVVLAAVVAWAAIHTISAIVLTLA